MLIGPVEHNSFPVSSLLKNWIGCLEHNSFPMSSSLKNESDPYKHSLFLVSSLCKNETYKHSLLLVSSLCKNETYEHSYFHVSSSLKNETNPSPIESSFLWNLGLEPSFHSLVLLDFLSPLLNVFPLVTVILIGWRKESMNELKLGGHATNLYWLCWGAKYQPLDIMLGRNPLMGIFWA